MRVFVIELTAYDPATSSVVTLGFSDGGYDNGGVFYEPRVENPGSLRREVSLTALTGRSGVSYGEATLINVDGGINYLADLFFDGRNFTLRYGDENAAIGSMQTLLVATIVSLAFEDERVSIRLRDRAETLDQPFQTAKYAGSNMLPNGIEGTADDIKGQEKPRVFGRVGLVTPVLVNTSKLIYQASASALDAVINVFDAGAYLARTATEYASQADMEANQPSPGTFRAWSAGGCFRLGSSPYGAVTCTVAEKWDYLQISASGIIKRILQQAGFSAADWVESDFAALNQQCAGPLGVVVSSGETTASLLDRICATVGAWWGFDAINRFRVARLEAPAGTPVAVLTEDDLIDPERQPETTMPIWQITLRADINYALQDKKSLAGVVPESRAAWFNAESRDQKAANESIKTVRLLAADVTVDSVFAAISQAQAEATRRLALLSVRRDTVTCSLPDPVSHGDLDLGSVVAVHSDRLGYTGRLMVITSIEQNFSENRTDLTLWG